jgi:hypothetical protein
MLGAEMTERQSADWQRDNDDFLYWHVRCSWQREKLPNGTFGNFKLYFWSWKPTQDYYGSWLEVTDETMLESLPDEWKKDQEMKWQKWYQKQIEKLQVLEIK